MRTPTIKRTSGEKPESETPMMKRKLLHDSDDDDGGVEDSPAFKEKEVT